MTLVHESVTLSNRYDVLENDLDVVVEAAPGILVVRKRRAYVDSAASDHSQSSQAHRQASIERDKTRLSVELPHATSLVEHQDITSAPPRAQTMPSRGLRGIITQMNGGGTSR